ncbi:hypothetical protein [Halogranum rubrum]|uniref:Uncharacterized protein n=1 Tax=Halogranum salarium B-1 TaxID=1210908 RepID=J2ZX78_9EURY|nr:hypothetical protein [Halogranum salarium]EJN57643.1 hypothetical protein HSB1_40040 [Halogranum salarium B-1]
MVPPAGDGASPAPIDLPTLEFLQTRLRATAQVAQAIVTDESGHLELSVTLTPSYYSEAVEEASLTVRWYTNDDFNRHPNPHNTRDHLHPPPTALTPGDDASWATDYRDVLRLVLDEVEERVATLWDE